MEIAAEILAELKARAEIQQPEELEAEELEVFNSLRLSVVDAAEAAAEVLVELTGETELARTEPVRTELARTEPVRTELARTEFVQTELVQTELV